MADNTLAHHQILPPHGRGGVQPSLPHPSCGYCRDCRTDHTLGAGRAADEALRMMDGFRATGRLDYQAPTTHADPRLCGSRLWEPEGRMFGVLECGGDDDRPVFLRAFSSLPRRTQWLDGWVPPLTDRSTRARDFLPAERRIKHLTRRIDRLPSGSPKARGLMELRRELSRDLMDALLDRRRVRNRFGSRSIREAFAEPGAIPGGTGDCCAPRLLTHAARLGLRPRGLVEFFWGGSGSSETRGSGRFYAPCETRCRHLLGFLLCGVES